MIRLVQWFLASLTLMLSSWALLVRPAAVSSVTVDRYPGDDDPPIELPYFFAMDEPPADGRTVRVWVGNWWEGDFVLAFFRRPTELERFEAHWEELPDVWHEEWFADPVLVWSKVP